MFQSITDFFSKKPPQKGGPLVPEPPFNASALKRDTQRQQTFSKVFRWRLPAGQMKAPHSVEVIGSFTHWQPVPLLRDSVLDAWHATLHHLAGNRTHHYMILVDGKPWMDPTCDGMAVPRSPEEEQYQVQTDKGPRVMMLFAQTK